MSKLPRKWAVANRKKKTLALIEADIHDYTCGITVYQ